MSGRRYAGGMVIPGPREPGGTFLGHVYARHPTRRNAVTVPVYFSYWWTNEIQPRAAWTVGLKYSSSRQICNYGNDDAQWMAPMELHLCSDGCSDLLYGRLRIEYSFRVSRPLYSRIVNIGNVCSLELNTGCRRRKLLGFQVEDKVGI